jgi:hypothetical protein
MGLQSAFDRHLRESQVPAGLGRRFAPPWHADKMPGGYVVRDANGQALAHLYSRENEDEARQANVLTPDEARRIAVNMAGILWQVGDLNGRDY